MKRWFLWCKDFGQLFFNYPVSAFAAQTTFFLIISAFPFAMLLITLMSYIPGLEQQMLQSELGQLMPTLFNDFANRIFEEIYQGRNVALISVTAFSALFAASKGFASLIRGMNLVYGIREQRNFFAVRSMALLCTLTMLSAMLLTFLLMVFGDYLLSVVAYYLPAFSGAAVSIISYRVMLIYVFLVAMFLLVYLLIPNRKSTFKAELPGALLAATGWILFSMLYSLYLTHVNTYIYGSLTSAVFIMLWLYFCIYILFVGAEINRYLRLKRLQFTKENDYVSRNQRS